MQIAGNKCQMCKRPIVFSNEGKFCPGCGTYVHPACQSQLNCEVCNQTYKCYEPPLPDIAVQAIVPPCLRPSRGTGAMLGALLVAISFILFCIILFFLQ